MMIKTSETSLQDEETPEERRERKRKSRWSTAKSFVPGMPTILPSDIDEIQRQSYLCMVIIYFIVIIL